MYYDPFNYNYSGINTFTCRYCSEKGSICGQTAAEKLISPCICTNMNTFAHPLCLKQYIETSTYAYTYNKCPVCHTSYKIFLNQNFNIILAKKLFYGAFLLELIKYILIILMIFLVNTILVMIFNEYVFNYADELSSIGLSYSASILLISICLFLSIGNLLALIKVVCLYSQYNKVKYCVYRKKNYDAYKTLIKGQFCNNIFQLGFIVLITLLFLPVSFIIIMLGMHIYHRKNQLKNKYYGNMYVSIQ